MSDYDLSTLKSHKDGTAPEVGGAGTAGLYRHPDTGAEVHTKSDPLFGDTQSNAFERLGFVRVRDSKPEEVKDHATLALIQHAERQATNQNGLENRLAAMEATLARNASLEAQLKEVQGNKVTNDHPVASGAAADTVQDAVDATAARTGTEPVQTREVETPKPKVVAPKKVASKKKASK